MCLSLYLASGSPQRFRLLRALGLEFEVIHSQIDESAVDDEAAAEYVSRLAVQKSITGSSLVKNMIDDFVVVGADTCVVIDDVKLGKPSNRSDAFRMLRTLSGRMHEVYSAIAVTDKQTTHCATVVTRVEFSALTQTQIDAFLDSGEAEKRAGAYGIQGKAAEFVTRLEGSWSSVIGLPIRETVSLLRDVGVLVPNYDQAAQRVKNEYTEPPVWGGQYYI